MKKIAKTLEFKNLIEVTTYFAEESRCKEHLYKLRWNGGEPVCPHCGHDKAYNLKKEFTYKCAKCRKPFSVTKGTIFENSPISLQKWFVAIYLITSHKKGISSLQLSKDISITQKSAWFLLQRIRYAVRTRDFNKQLENDVEIDETYVGGKNKNRHFDKRVEFSQGRSGKDKVAVFGILERKGKVVAMSVKNTSGKVLKPLILKHVSNDANLMSDEWNAYKGLNRFFNHQIVRHGQGEYVNGNVHTNTIEGFWSLLKRGIIGIYHNVSLKHIDKYIDEFEYRYNTRHKGESERFLNMLSKSNSRLDYATLTANNE
jgi:transposase-like protein